MVIVYVRKFIEKHGKLAEKLFVAGNRVLISERYTKETLNYKTEPSNFYFKNLIKTKMQKNCNKISTLIPIPLAGLRKIFPYKWKKAKGCNLGIWKKDLLNINGFDECYEGWGYEDSDMVIRLMNSGVKRKSGKFAVTVIHLGHPILSRSNEKQNYDKLMQTLKSKITLPKLGIK